MSSKDPFDFRDDEDGSYVIKRYFSKIPIAWAEEQLSRKFSMKERVKSKPNFTLLMLKGDTVGNLIKDNCFVESGGYYLCRDEIVPKNEKVTCYLITIDGSLPPIEKLAARLIQYRAYPLTSKYLLEFGIEYPDEITAEKNSPILALGEYFLRQGGIHGETQIWVNAIDYGGYYQNLGKRLIGIDLLSETYGYHPQGADKKQYRLLVTNKRMETPLGEKIVYD